MSDEPFDPSTIRQEPSSPNGRLAAGTVLLDVYEILGPLGSGGMGAVYRARHRDLGEQRAIKLMHPGIQGSDEGFELFLREARAMLKIRHDAVAHCHDLLRDGQGCVYLVMELIEGPSLSFRLRQGPLEEAAVWQLGERLAAGLTAAHERGIIHRDLSPANVLLPAGQPECAKLIDFGIAKLLGGGERTLVPGFKGKFSYASPEQLGLFGGGVDGRSDLYSLGLVLAAAASGRALPMGATQAEAVEQRRVVPPSLRQAVSSPRLRTLIEALLAPDPADRPGSAAEVFGGPRPSPRLRGAVSAGGRPRSRLAVAALAAAGLAVLLGSWVLSLDEFPGAGSAHSGQLVFEDLRQRLLEVPVGPGRARVWTMPNPVVSGQPYRVAFEVGCECDALLFAIFGNEDVLMLVYPNGYDEARRLRPGEWVQIPSNLDRYTLEAEGGLGVDTLKLLVLPDSSTFPSGTIPAGQFWSATPTDSERLAELAALLDAEPLDSAQATLRISP